MKISILINTYNRPEKLLLLLKDIKKQQQYLKQLKIRIVIVDDKSTDNYKYVYLYLKQNFKDYYFYKSINHQGKRGYWRLINKGYQLIKQKAYDYFFQFPDDIRLTHLFFFEAITEFNYLNDKNKACINILFDGRIKQNGWVNCDIKETKTLYKTNWVDLCLVSDNTYLKTLGYTVNPIGNIKKNQSSGVGKQLSRRLVEKNKTIWLVKTSLVIHGAHVSKMHPKQRELYPLITNHKIIFNNTEEVIAGMAAIKSRIKVLRSVVLSILPQVSELHIYLNDYSKVPDFLKNNEKIKPYLAKNHKGDLGDRGKFFAVNKANGYYITIDDDLIYPPDYVEKLIEKIERYSRKAIISFHGRELKKGKINNYYHKSSTKLLRCLRTVKADQYVHIGGTGVMGFHTDTIPEIKLTDFKQPNMADVWMGRLAQKYNIPIIVAEHRTQWIRQANINLKNTIAYKEKHKAKNAVTNIINIKPWIMNTLKNDVIDIVIPFVTEQNEKHNALKYALRSIEENFTDDFRLVIIGDMPDFIDANKIMHIPFERLGGFDFANCVDANRKINEIILSPDISEKFIFTYDDIYLLKEADTEELSKMYQIETIKNLKPTKKYRQLLINTFATLKKAKLTDYNCETHLPRVYSKKNMIAVFKAFLPIKNKLLVHTLYSNFHKIKPIMLEKGDDIKAGYYGKSDKWSYSHKSNKATLLKTINRCMFLNHNDAGLSDKLIEVIQERFPEPSSFELKNENI